MESDGRLIADSTGVPTLHARDGRVERIGAMRSTHAEIRAAAAAISQRLAPGAGGAWSGSLKVEGKTPVSYTHLDVYKRQNLDYASEADMVKKFRVSLALQPVATALFADSPFTDGQPNGCLLYTSRCV